MKPSALISKLLSQALLLLVSCPLAQAQGTASPAKPATPASPLVSKNNLVSRTGFQFMAAGGWIELKTKPEHAALAGPASTGHLNPSFTVLSNPLDPKMKFTLGEVSDFNRSKLSSEIKDAKMLSDKTVKVGGTVLGVLWSYSGTQEGVKFQWTQLLTIKNDVLYTATLALPEGTLPKVAAAGREMLESFKLK